MLYDLAVRFFEMHDLEGVSTKCAVVLQPKFQVMQNEEEEEEEETDKRISKAHHRSFEFHIGVLTWR